MKYLSLLLVLLLALPLAAAPPIGKGEVQLAQQTDNTTYIDGNRILMFVTNHGNFGRDLSDFFGYDYGTFFPYAGDPARIDDGSASESPYYAGGLWIGAVDSATGETRVAVAEYSDEYVPGPMANGTFIEDIAEFKVYKLYSDSLEDNPNADYTNWPSATQNAPLNDEGLPDAIGTQMCWAVFNDANPAQHANSSGETEPLGIEVRQSTFCFDREDPLGQIIFMRFRIYNKGGNTLEDCYFSIWSDPDLGGSGDDLVGCDVAEGIGYVYNDNNNDQYYEDKPPCLGIDFFQGPLQFTGEDSDTAKMWDTTWVGYTNMPMTSFNKYINGTDPDDFNETYRFMRGLNKDGTDYVDPSTGLVSLFVHSGDPVTGIGDIDVAPADRRNMINTGPITFRPGDSTEIVAAMIVAQAIDRKTSISLMRYYDRFAQTTYDDDFVVKDPPVAPVVSVGVDQQTVSLSWTDTSEVDHGSYPFEGYIVWQGETPSGPWTQVVAHDVANTTEDIFDEVFDPVTAVPEIRLIKNGTNLGVQRYVVIDEDFIIGGTLHDLTEYYYKVEAYSYDPGAGLGLKTLTSAMGVTATPQAPIADMEFNSVAEEVLAVSHTAGVSGGVITPIVVDPSTLTGHTYQIYFMDTLAIVVDTIFDPVYPGDLDHATFDSTNVAWFLDDVTAGTTLLEWQTNQEGDDDYQVVDGFMVKVSGPPAGFNSFQVVANGAGVLDPVESAGAPWYDFPTPPGPADNGRPTGTQQVGDGLWMFHTADNGGTSGGGSRGNYAAFLSRALRDGGNDAMVGIYDFEMRFTGDNASPGTGGGYAIEWYNDDNVFWVPFELWRTGIGTPDDPSDDVRLHPYIIDEAGDPTTWPGDDIYALESWGVLDTTDLLGSGGGDLEHSVSGGDNDPFTDWVYWRLPPDETPGSAGYDAIEAAYLAGTYSSSLGTEIMARTVLVNWNGDPESDGNFNQDVPEMGTVIRLTTAKPNASNDVFEFTAPAPSDVAKTEDLLDDIKAVPNPFYMYGTYDPNPASKLIKFHHLPAECTITIYSLGGEYITEIEKNDPTTAIAEWNVLTERGLPVASGVYIFVVDAPGFGQKIGKMAIFTEAEVLDIY